MIERRYPEFRWLERGEGEAIVLLHGLMGAAPARAQEVTISAAISMKEVVEEVGRSFGAARPASPCATSSAPRANCSSVLGVAGGELIIPTLVFVFGAGIKVSGTSSLLISVPTILVGLWRHASARALADAAT